MQNNTKNLQTITVPDSVIKSIESIDDPAGSYVGEQIKTWLISIVSDPNILFGTRRPPIISILSFTNVSFDSGPTDCLLPEREIWADLTQGVLLLSFKVLLKQKGMSDRVADGSISISLFSGCTCRLTISLPLSDQIADQHAKRIEEALRPIFDNCSLAGKFSLRERKAIFSLESFVDFAGEDEAQWAPVARAMYYWATSYCSRWLALEQCILNEGLESCDPRWEFGFQTSILGNPNPDLPLIRHIKAINDKFYSGIAYVELLGPLGWRRIGAYYGYCGGGAWDGGFFIVDLRRSQNLDFEEADNHLLSAYFDALMEEVSRYYEDEDGNPPRLADYAKSLLENCERDEDGVATYWDDEFDGDELCEISQKWAINLRF